jgi:hypothetical protein
MGAFDLIRVNAASKEARQADADAQVEALKNGEHKGSSSWGFGRGGRTSTDVSLFGLGRRVESDAARENAKSGFFGLFGAKYVAEKAKRAQRDG